jgi:hypothetical protein
MMKRSYFLFLILVTLTVSCEKESLSPSNTTSNNYLKANVSGREFVVYEDSSLNNDTIPNLFRFSFGQSVTDEMDTCFFLSACLNGQSLHISFPRPTECVTYDIYCDANTSGQPSAIYSLVPDSDNENGLVTFYTQNVSKNEGIEGQRIGRVDIDIIDEESRLVKGRFNFAAYGYEVPSTETFIPTNSLIIVTSGEFYYKWKESLDI